MSKRNNSFDSVKNPSAKKNISVHYLDKDNQKSFVKGWKFDGVDLAQDTIGLFATDSDNSNYIPYKHLSTFSYTSVDSQAKTLQAQYQTPNNKGVVIFEIVFDYDSSWENINEASLNKIVEWLLKARNEQLTEVMNLKETASNLASAYFTSKSGIESLTEDESKQTQKLAQLKEHKKALEAKLKELQAQRETHRATVLKNEQELGGKKSEVVVLEDKIIAENSKVESNSQQKTQLETNMKLNIQSKSNFENQKLANRKQIENLRDAVTEECGTQKQTLLDAVSGFFQKCDAFIKLNVGEVGCTPDINTFSDHIIALFPTNK